MRAASESVSAASESCSEASRSLRAASDSLRSASRSVNDAAESLRAASAIRVVWSLGPRWPMRPAPAPPGLPMPAPVPLLERKAGSHAGRHGGSEGPRRGLSGRIGRVASWFLIALGALILIDAGVTVVWQEPVTALYAMVQQEELSGSLEKLDRATPSPVVAERLALLHDRDARVALLARELEHTAPQGSAVGRLVIPSIGASYAVVKGTSTADLEEGPGVYSRSEYPQSMFPGLGGVTAIAGHRTTFLAPFRHIDELHNGDRISIKMPYARFAYVVQRTRIVGPKDVRAVLYPGGGTRLVLSSCNPPFSAAQRILVYARLTSVTPLGAAHSYLQSLVTRSYPSSRLASELELPNSGLKARLLPAPR
jgi:sortase A